MESCNRILNEITAWNDKLKNLQEVFGNHVTDYRYLNKAKLDYFKKIKAQYKVPANEDEKLAFKVLQVEVQRLEKIVFPNRIERYIRKAIENTHVIYQKVLWLSRGKQPDATKDEIGKSQKPVELSNDKKNLNKTAIQYNKKLKAVSDDTLLPKLRNGSGKGLKM